LPYRDLPEPPTIFFFGDGVSDLSAARHADLLFVKLKDDGENDLAAFCQREGINNVKFRSFHNALDLVKRIVCGEKNIQDAIQIAEI
jgi:2-hydroxy-3-keto-5-methylthiopentenyl-1-phosphate phosphatase